MQQFADHYPSAFNVIRLVDLLQFVAIVMLVEGHDLSSYVALSNDHILLFYYAERTDLNPREP